MTAMVEMPVAMASAGEGASAGIAISIVGETIVVGVGCRWGGGISTSERPVMLGV